MWSLLSWLNIVSKVNEIERLNVEKTDNNIYLKSDTSMFFVPEEINVINVQHLILQNNFTKSSTLCPL